MSILVTMRVKVHDLEGTEHAVANYGFVALIDLASDWDDAA
jgi:hypothetical protein